jgi:hypothetical protein
VLAATPTTTTTQKFQRPFVSGSIALGSTTFQPAKGRISSDGSGSSVDSMTIATNTPP